MSWAGDKALEVQRGFDSLIENTVIEVGGIGAVSHLVYSQDGRNCSIMGHGGKALADVWWVIEGDKPAINIRATVYAHGDEDAFAARFQKRFARPSTGPKLDYSGTERIGAEAAKQHLQDIRDRVAERKRIEDASIADDLNVGERTAELQRMADQHRRMGLPGDDQVDASAYAFRELAKSQARDRQAVLQAAAVEEQKPLTALATMQALATQISDLKYETPAGTAFQAEDIQRALGENDLDLSNRIKQRLLTDEPKLRYMSTPNPATYKRELMGDWMKPPEEQPAHTEPPDPKTLAEIYKRTDSYIDPSIPSGHMRVDGRLVKLKEEDDDGDA